jgi:cob(I)alamin adenosyltransferase
MKATTGGGDRGRTGLLSGERVGKDDPLIEAIGDVDELNSAIGVLISSLSEAQATLGKELEGIQDSLFALGARLAASPGSAGSELLDFDLASPTLRLETAMNAMEGALEALRDFILPGGHPAAAWAQLARSICRRAERRVVALASASSAAAEYYSQAMAFLNRLSDYLFTLGRECNRREALPDRPWRR